MDDALQPGRNRLAGKTALVIGAGSILPGWGNGKAAAVVFAREGAKVMAVDHRLDAAEETVRLIRDAGGEAEACAGDATNRKDVQAMVDACRDAFGGRIDVLHNNVGGSGPGQKLEDVTDEDWRATLDRNVTSAFLSCQIAAELMATQGGGSIVNVSSIAGIRHLTTPTTVYSTGKAALNAFTQNIALQYAKRNVRANCVLPGYIETPFIQREIDGVPAYARKGFPDAESYHAARDEIIPMGRMGTGFDVAYAALFLASDEAAYITGQTLVVDGGVTATCPGV